MYWKIGSYIFYETKRTLVDEQKNAVELEPLLTELLSYFCRNPNTVISRDCLVEQVWQSKAVTDNAVNRVVAKLRKALRDDIKAPKYIVTYPRKGYKFIASIQPYTEQEAILTAKEVSSSNDLDIKQKLFNKKFTIWFGVIISLSLLALTMNFWPAKNNNVNLVKFEALTRGGEQEVLPSVSPNGRYLAYTAMVKGNMRLFVKDLRSQEMKEVGNSRGGSGPASWSIDSKELVYLYTNDNDCRYIKIMLDGLNVVNKESIHICPVGSFGKMAFTHDNERLIYTENKGYNTAYSLYELNLATSLQTRLVQPELILGGNFQFDIHPHQNKVLISSPDERQWLGLYSLDLSTSQLELLFKLDKYTCCAIWNHTGDRVVLIGESSSGQLVSFNRDGSDRTILYQVTHSINNPVRFPNGSGYVYSGGTLNKDIKAYKISDDRTEVVVNTSVKDRLPSVSHDGKWLAYTSLSSGAEEIWVQDLTTSRERKLTSLNKNAHFFDLKWSEDNRMLAALTVNGIYLIDLKRKTTSTLDLPQREMRYISFKDANSISFSVKEGNDWVVQTYNLDNGQVDTRRDFAAVLYNANADDTLWLDHAGNIRYGVNKTKIAIPENLSRNGRNFKVVKKGSNIFYLSNEQGRNSINQIELKAHTLSKLYTGNEVSNFALSNDVIFTEEESDFSADIIKASAN